MLRRARQDEILTIYLRTLSPFFSIFGKISVPCYRFVSLEALIELLDYVSLSNPKNDITFKLF